MKTDTENTLPKGSELNARNERYRNDMHQVLDELRSKSAVHEDNEFHRWYLTQHGAIGRVLRNVASCGRDWEVAAEGTWGKIVPPRIGKFGMVDEDGDKHRRLRGLVSKSFTPKTVAPRGSAIELRADQWIDKVRDRSEFDFIREIAAPLPTMIMAEILGVKKEDQEDFKRWSDEWVYIIDPDISPEEMSRAVAANQSLERYFLATVKERAIERQDDLISKLIHDGIGDETLSTEEIATICLQLIVAGNITSADLIGNGLVALLKNPEQLALLRERPELMSQAVEEMLRYDCPVTEIPRFCYEDIEVEGVEIDKGQTVTLNLAAANHDPAVYECPHQFDIERPSVPHHAFGGGAHLCLGIHLARHEIEITFAKLLEAFPVLKLADKTLARKAVPTFSGFKEVWVCTR